MILHWFTINLGYQGDGRGGSRPIALVLEATPDVAARHFEKGWPIALAHDHVEATRFAMRLAREWAAQPLRAPVIAARGSTKPNPTTEPAACAVEPVASLPSTESDMAAAVAPAKASGRGKRSRTEPQDEASNTAAKTPAETLESARSILAAAEDKLERIDVWKRDAIAEQPAVVEQARSAVAAAELAVMPMPPAMALAFTEAEPFVGEITTTGNHRERIDDVGLQQLARSIQIHGLQQRVGVRTIGDGSYELIFGARRLAATKLAGLTSIPAKVYAQDLTAAQVEILRTIENFGRQDLTAVEKALAVARTIDAIERTLAPLAKIGGSRPAVVPDTEEFAAWAKEFTASVDVEFVRTQHGDDVGSAVELTQGITAAGGLNAYVGQQLGFSAKWIQDHAYVSKLGGEARQLLAANRITIGHARELAKLGDKDAADTVAHLVSKDETGLGGESVEQCRKYVEERLRSLKGVPWELAVAFGQGVKGCTGYACSTCPFNSKADPDLFGGALADEPQQGTCTNETCFKAKQDIAAKDLAKIVAKAKPKVEAGKIDATENGVRDLVPLHIRASTAARKVKKETTEPAAGGKSSGGKTEKVDPIVAVKKKYEGDREKWAEAATKKIWKAIDAPEQRLAYDMLTSCFREICHAEYRPYYGTADVDAEKQRNRAAAETEKEIKKISVEALVSAITSPTFAKILELRGDQLDSNTYPLAHADDRVIQAFAKTLKIDLPAPPDRAAMIAAATKPAAKDKAAKRPAARAVAATAPPVQSASREELCSILHSEG